MGVYRSGLRRGKTLLDTSVNNDKREYEPAEQLSESLECLENASAEALADPCVFRALTLLRDALPWAESKLSAPDTTRMDSPVLSHDDAEWLREVLERERDEDDAAGAESHGTEDGYWHAGICAERADRAERIIAMIPSLTWPEMAGDSVEVSGDI